MVQQFNLTNCVKCHIVSCNLTYFCQALKMNSQIKLLNVAFNNISDINSNCFQQSDHLRFVDLSTNAIVFIQSGLFENLNQLKLVNLSSNPIKTLHTNTFNNVSKLFLISLRETNMLRAKKDVFHTLSFKILETNNYLTCCLAPNETVCTAVKPWFFSCTDLLTNIVLNVVFSCVSFFILIANCLCVIVLRISFRINHRKGLEKTGAFSVSVALVNVSGIFCCLPLIVLWAVDLTFMGEFFLIASQWRSSVLCFSILALFSFFSFLSPLLLSIFSLSRLQIVKFPMNTMFKETQFVLKCSLPLFCASGLISTTLTLLSWFIDVQKRNVEMQMVICFPFVDPSDKMILAKVTTALAITLQIVAVVFIATVYIICFFL